MYIPKYHKIEDPHLGLDFIKKYSFATVIGQVNKKIEAVHIPLEAKLTDDALYLQGHVAKANPIGNLVSGEEVLAIFSEPHAYVSSSWYDHINVPTWNYIAVHAYGQFRVLENEELLDSINKLVDRYEDGRPNRYNTSDMPPDMLQAHLDGLIGLEMKVTDLQAKYKLSQNRDDKNFKVIIEKLEQSEFPLEREIAKEMQKLRPNLHEGH